MVTRHEDVISIYRSGVFLFDQKKYQQATHNYFRRVIRLAPRFSNKILMMYEVELQNANPPLELQESLAELYQAEGNLLEAIDEFEEIIERDPFNMEYYKKLAGLYFKTKQYDEVVDLLARLYERGIFDEELINYLAASYLEIGQLSQAIDIYEKLILMNGEREGYYKILSDLYFRNNEITKAVSCSIKRLDLNRQSAPDVIDFIEKCHKINPLNDGVIEVLIGLDIACQRPEQAVELLKVLLCSENRSAKEGFVLESIRLLDKDYPSFPSTMQLKGEYFMLIERYVESADSYWELARNPHFEKLAIEGLKKILDVYPEQVSALQYLGEYYKGHGDTESSLFYMRRMLQVDFSKSIAVISQCRDLLSEDPQNADAKLTIAEAYFNRDNLDGTIDIAKDLIRRGENELESTLLLLKAYLKKADFSALREVLESRRLDFFDNKIFYDLYRKIYPEELSLLVKHWRGLVSEAFSLEKNINLVHALIEAESHEEALIALQQMVVDHVHPALFHLQSYCYEGMGNPFSATAYLKKALDLVDSDHSRPYQILLEELARSYEMIGDVDRSLEGYRKLLEINFQRDDIKEREHILKNCPYLDVTGKSLILVSRDLDCTRFVAVFNRNLLRKKQKESHDSSMGILKNNEAVEDIFKGKLASAHDLIDMAMKMDPAHKNILNNKGVIYILQKDFQSGSKIFERILRDKTSLSAGALYNMAFAYTYGLNKRDEARQLVDQLLEIDPELYEAYLLSGDLAYHVGDMKRARDHWNIYAQHGLLPVIARRRLFEIDFIPYI